MRYFRIDVDNTYFTESIYQAMANDVTDADIEEVAQETMAALGEANADHIDTEFVINKIDPDKDVDGLTNANAGKLMNGQKGIIPCTPKGIMRLFKEYAVDLNGKNAIVIGRSILVGKPIAMLMLQANATVTIAHSKTKNLEDICKTKDIIVSAVGKPKFVTGEMVKEGAVVVDVGINRVHGTIVGDVEYHTVEEKASRLTPVPGGVGPMTIACLLENVVECYKIQRGIK